MVQLTLEVPDTVVERLATIAARDAKRIDQVATEQLVAANTGSARWTQDRIAALFEFLESQPRLTDEEIHAFEEALRDHNPPSRDESLFEGPQR